MSTSTFKLTDIVNEFNSSTDIQKVLEMVKMAEITNQHQDMRTLVKKLVELKSKTGESLDLAERNLLLCAYKNVTADKRASWRTLSMDGYNETEDGLTQKYKSVVEDELEVICKEVLDLLLNHLYTKVEGERTENEVFYLKMCGDYYRYLSEFRQDARYKNSSKQYYAKALEIADEALCATHPTKLGLALNFSVHIYENLKDPQEACDLAQKTFGEAIENLDSLEKESYKDAVLILQLLRDNLTLWTMCTEQEQ
eukprot:396956_1